MASRDFPGPRELCYTALVRQRYPLDTLHWLRHQRVDRQAKAVGEEAKRTVQAKAAELGAEQQRLQHEQAVAALSDEERARLEQGELRASDLQALVDWQRGADAELQAKLEREQRARDAHAQQIAQEREARRVLGQTSNEAKMIDTHRSTFRSEQAATEERSAEEAATEQWTASRFPPRRS